MLRGTLALLLLTRCLLSPAGADQQVTLSGIEDGDTVAVELRDETLRLQLLGIDAPEDVRNPKFARDQKRTGLSAATLLELGAASSRHLRSLIAPGERVIIVGDLGQPDKYGRYPVLLQRPDGLVINDAMVASGYAIVLDSPFLPEGMANRLRRLQDEAIATPVGLWKVHAEAAERWSGRRP